MAKIRQVFSNNAKTTLDAQLLAGGASMTVAAGDGALFETITLASEEFEKVTLIRNGPNGPADDAIEIIHVHEHTGGGDTFQTIVRGQEGTSPIQFEIGDEVDARWTAGTGDRVVQTEPPGVTPLGTDAINIQPRRASDGQVAAADDSIAIGRNSEAIPEAPGDGPGTIVIGFGAQGRSGSPTSNASPVVIGSAADGHERDVAIGSSAFAGSTASTSGGKRNVVIGADATIGTAADYSDGVVIGESAGQATQGNNVVVVGRGAAASGDNAIVIGSGAGGQAGDVSIGVAAFHAGQDNVGVGRGANPFGSGGLGVAVGRGAECDTEGIAIGAFSLGRERMCHVAAPIYVQDDAAYTEGDELIKFAGAEVALGTKSYDFTSATPFTAGASATLDVVVPSGMKFYPDSVEFVTDTFNAVTNGPTLSVGTPAAPTQILNNQPVTGATVGQSGGRETFPTASEIGVTTVRVTVDAAAAATTLTGRVILRGLFIRNAS